MEEVDGLLIRAMDNLGCDLEEVKSLKELSTEQTIEGVVRCLWQILPSSGIESYKLPPNMTAKFRMGTSIARAINEAGYRGDIGYQTLLYGSEAEIRRIFVFLIEKLPKEAAISSDREEMSAIDLTKMRGGRNVEEGLKAPWTPWFCHRLKYRWDGRFWRPPEGPEDVRFHALPDLFVDGTLAAVSRWKDLPASILEQNASTYHRKEKKARLMSLEEMKEVVSKRQTQEITKRSTTRPKLPPKPKLLPKPGTGPEKDDASPSSQENSEGLPEVSEEERMREVEMLSIHETMDSIGAEIRMVLDKISQQRLSASQEARNLGQIEQRSEELNDIRKMATLLENPSESIEKLQTFLERSDGRLARLENQYAQHSLPKQEELAELGQGVDKSEQLLVETRNMQRKAGERASEIEAKRAFLLQLQRELERMSKGLNRSAYTRRILEIVANVRKQREQIDKTMEDTRGVQKEINMLSGKLDRTFTAADELLFRDAKTEETVRRSYKLMVNVHEKCGEVVRSVEETGRICREIQDLQDSIETESQKSTDANLEKLVNDFCEVKQENDNLSHRLKLLQASM